MAIYLGKLFKHTMNTKEELSDEIFDGGKKYLTLDEKSFTIVKWNFQAKNKLF